jgi:Na+/glutamate symporter
METVSFSETSVKFYKITQYYTPLLLLLLLQEIIIIIIIINGEPG